MGNDEVRIKIKIDSNSQELVLLKQQVKNVGNSFNKTESMAATFISRLALIGGAVGGLYLINKTIGDIGRSGFETNRTIQKLTNSLATSIAITSANVDSTSKQISLSEKYAMATNEARLSLEQLNKINLDTPHTLDQTVKIYDAMYIGMKKVGAQSEDIVDITKKLSIAVGDKVGFEAMLSAMDGLSTGTVEISSEMGRFLNNIGLTNEAIKNSTDVVQLFKDKLSGVKAIESFDTKLSNLTNSYNMLSKEITESAFNKIEDNLKPVAEILDSLKDNLPSITNAAGEIVQIGTSIGIATLAIKGYTTASKFAVASNILLGGSYGAVNRSILLTTASTRIFSTVLKATPFGLAATAVYFLSDAFMDNAEKSKILEDAYNGVGDRLKGLTKNQLEYTKSLLIPEMLKQNVKTMDALSIVKNKNRKATLEELSDYDEQNKKLQEMRETLVKINEVINKPKAKTVYEFDTTEIDKLVNDTLNPYGSRLDEINNKWLSHYNLLVKNGKDTSNLSKAQAKEIADLDKEFADKKESLLKSNQKLLKDQEKSAESLNESYVDIAQIGMSEYDKAIISIIAKYQSWVKDGVSLNDALAAQSKLLDELNTKRASDNTKEDLSYYERLVQLKSDSYEKEIELANISYAQKFLELEQTTKTIAEKDRLISKETELYNATIQTMNIKNNTEFEDTMKTFYDDMLDSQLALNSAVYDFGSGFGEAASKIGAVSKSLAAMSSLELTNKKEASKLDKKYIEQFNKYAGDVGKTKELEQQYTKDTALLNEQNIQASLNGYANIAGAMSGMFEQGSRDAAAFQLVETGLALASGIRAILTQGSGDPYTAFARMASMAAIVSQMLGNIGVAFGMNTTTTSSDSFSAQEANTGTGSVLGDATAQSESMVNALSILEDFAQPQFQTLQSMNKYLENISNNIGGVTSLLIQQGGFSFGAGASEYDTGFSNNIGTNNTMASLLGGAGGLALAGATGGFGAMGALSFAGPAGLGIMALDKLLLGGAITDLFGGVINSVLGGLFGKKSVSQALTDSGIYFADTLLTSAIEQINGEAYQTIATTTKKKTWFSSSSSTSVSSYFDELDDETERQFSLVLSNLYNTVTTAGDALDTNSVELENQLNNFIISIGKISLKGKSGAEIQEALTAVFGKIGDDISKTAFPLLTPFQQIGEGMFETLTRVATGMEVAEYYISRLGNKFDDVIYTAIGNKQGDVGFEALLQSIEKIENAIYPANNGLLNIIENLSGTAEELYSAYTSLDELRDRLIFLKQEALGLSNAMIYGAGSMSALDEGFKSYFDNFLSENEKLTYETQQLIDEFNNLGIALPISKDAFKDLLSSLDLTTKSGQELYGRLIILSEGFATVADETKKSIEDLTTSLTELSTNSFDTFISSLASVGDTITSIKNTALGFIQGLSTSNTASLEDQLIAYNKLRGQFSNYFDNEGNIKAGANQSEATGIYSQISSLAQSIGGKDDNLKNSLVSQFENDIYSFNASEDILKVSIVEGLANLEGLNSEQTKQLIEAVKDGKVTNTELNNINGLTQIQKDNIIAFADNSEYFSTEDTLYSLNEYMKKQLEVLQATQAEETAGLSTKSFTYGDYIGKQEQIDIATKLGMSYESAQPLVEKLQTLSISKNPTADLQSLLGYAQGATSYDTTTANQIKTLSPYLGIEVADTLKSVETNVNRNIVFEKAKADFENRYNIATANYQKELTESNTARDLFKAVSISPTSSYLERAEDISKGIAYKRSGYWTSGSNTQLNNSRYSIYGTEFNQTYSAYKLLQQLEQEKLLNSYAVGSASIEYDQIARIHEGEIITPRNFSDGIRAGDLSLGNNNEIVAAIKAQTLIVKAQANEIQKMKEAIEEMNTREIIKTAKGVA